MTETKNSEKPFIAFFLPNTFTALNIACGFVAIIFSMHGEFYKACMLIVLGALFDSVDGRVARLTGTQSAFGEQFDSLSDLITFGMGPAVIFYNRFFFDLGRAGLILSFLFLLAGALRLARFNANIDKVSSDYFQGLPIPGGATAAISLILLSLEVPSILEYKWLPIVYILFYAILMISTIPFPSFKKSPWVQAHKKRVLVIIFLMTASIFWYEEIMIPIIISIYVISSLVYFLFHRKDFKNVFEWKEDPQMEEH
ncbi:MAG: CDP-diacylglycerol--serine O-phosphatidyltransferase [Bacteriovoracaceae bacterium]